MIQTAKMDFIDHAPSWSSGKAPRSGGVGLKPMLKDGGRPNDISWEQARMALLGIKVIEFAGLAPAPFAGLVLADNGASVIRIDRPSSASRDILSRGKRSLAINPKVASGRDVLRKLIAAADVVVDPFRPGVLERLGLGPEVFLGSESNETGLNGRLVYARIAGFPRIGQYKHMAGHDINYLALSGILSMLPGSDEKPAFPLNLIADFAGGGLVCVTGILLALIERGKNGRGQVVNTDMVTGTRYLSSFPLIHRALRSFPFHHERGRNILDGGAPFYDVYTCQDGRWMSVGCLEPLFYTEFLERFLRALPPNFSIDGDTWRPTSSDQYDRNQWSKLRAFLHKGFKVHPRDHWADVFRDSDSCAVPVLTAAEAAELDHSRSSFPSAHPRVSTQTALDTMVSSHSTSLILRPGQHTLEVLQELGLDERERTRLALDGALGDLAQAEARLSSKL